MKTRVPLAAIVAAASLWGGAAAACSPAPGYRVPTNIELLERADLVVMARVAAGPQTCEEFGSRKYCRASVALSPVEVLKGEAPDNLVLQGELLGRQGESYPPEPTPLDQPHSSAWWGACVRQAYSTQALVLALFTDQDGHMVPIDDAFARVVEDVDGTDGLWVRAAELYLGILARTQGPARRTAFAQERDRLRAQGNDPEAQAIADDIEAYLDATQAQKGG